VAGGLLVVLRKKKKFNNEIIPGKNESNPLTLRGGREVDSSSAAFTNIFLGGSSSTDDQVTYPHVFQISEKQS
jgi:hypothetical protein